MTSCPSTQPLAGSPLALPPFVHLYFCSMCCSFFLPPETQTQQTPSRFILLCSQACALLGEAVGQHPGATPKAAPLSGPHLWPCLAQAVPCHGHSGHCLCCLSLGVDLHLRQGEFPPGKTGYLGHEGVRSSYCHTTVTVATVKGNVLMYM